MKIRLRSRRIIIAVPLLLAICGYFVHLRNERLEYRAKLALFTEELAKSSADTNAVRALISQPRFNGLELREGSATEWEVETPLEFGAGNWLLLIELRGSKVVALRVRTEDSTQRRPEAAPPDKFF